ncbi:MAG TPA: TetR/AcrR family transcriptional regulator, partial [Candidatus Limnocylindria bacterium]|nr:TetR/AcrR family transcriptional regulator [Candidatus Limnocylindria bacterium]
LREALVAAAMRQYAAGGRAGISYGALAQAVGLRKATVFHYFATKDAIVDAVFAALGRELAARRTAWFAAPPAAYAARLERVVGELVDFYDQDPLRARVICHGLLDGVRTREAGAEPALAAFVADFVAFLRAGMDAGEFYPVDPAGLMMTIGGMILFEPMLPPVARRTYGRGGPATSRRHELTALVSRAVVKGVRR